MADLNPHTPEDAARTKPRVVPSTPTGDWAPGAGSDVQLAVPQRVGQFQIEAVLGIGAFGRVFLAFDPKTGRQVAIKQPFGQGLNPEYRDDFLKEARAAAAIDQHANVCPVYHVDTDAGLPYIVMRFVPGGTLKNFLDRHAEPLPVRTALAFATKIARGLSAAHAKGIIHRDLKPANVLIDDANDELLITDFGLARITSRAQAAASLQRGAHGTALYMPPEQCGTQAFGPITPVADVYSLGIILYEMLTGKVPFIGTQLELMMNHCTEAPVPPSSQRPGLDPRLDAICLKALEKMPANRHPSARAFEDALAEYLSSTAAEPPRPEPRLPWADPLPDSPPKKPGVAPPGASTASRPDGSIDEKEIIRCPKCAARLEISKARARPVDCPMCNLKFAVEAGRQAAARASGSKEKLPLEEPREAQRDERRTRKRPRRAEPVDDDWIRPREWRAAARGLRLAWLGMILGLVCALGIILTFIATVSDGAPASSNSSSSTEKRPAETYSSRDNSGGTVFGLAYAVMGLGLAASVALTGIGRVIASRTPPGVGGGTPAVLSALAAWIGAACVAILFILIGIIRGAGGERPDSALIGGAGIAAGAAALVLLAGEFVFNGYLVAVSRHAPRGFPHTLTTVAKVFLWILIACVLFGGVSGVVAATVDETKQKPAVSFFAIVAGAAMCLSFVVVPFWGIITLWLNIQAAVAVGRYSRGEE